MSFSKFPDGQRPGRRQAGREADPEAEGLLDGEEALRLDSGHYVAVSVAQERLPNGGGVAFKVRVRWIEGTGKGRKDKLGRTVEANSSHTISAAEIERHGLATIQRQVVLLALGEEIEEFDVPVVKGAVVPDDLPPGHRVNPTATRAKILAVEDDVRLNASVRAAIKLANEIEPRADIAAALKL